jgi:hypothetical protein
MIAQAEWRASRRCCPRSRQIYLTDFRFSGLTAVLATLSIRYIAHARRFFVDGEEVHRTGINQGDRAMTW